VKRTFKFVAVTAGGTPQPVFGTTTSAAIVPNPANNPLQKIAVADSSWFHDKDWILLDPANATVAKREWLQVMTVVDSTHLNVIGPNGAPIQYSHNSGVYVQLAVPCLAFYVECKIGNAATIFIGTDSTMVKATGVFVLKQMAASGAGINPSFFSDPDYGLANAMKSDDYWFDGTTGDSILPSLTVL
jgi:hypothetical protein